MKLHVPLLLAAALLVTISACDSNGNQRDGVKDAFDSRPNEGLRDAGENLGEAVEDAGRGIKDAVNDK
jgi:hypothetical protein